MNRRRFLRLLGIAPVGIVAVPVMAPAIVQGRPTVYEIEPMVEVECTKGELVWIGKPGDTIEVLVERALRRDGGRDSRLARAMLARFGIA